MKTIKLNDKELMVIQDGLEELERCHRWCSCSFCSEHKQITRNLIEKISNKRLIEEKCAKKAR